MTATSAIYSDIQGLSSLRSQARQAPGEAVSEVATQFESLFVQMMLKSMRDATVDGGLFDSSQLETYQQMFDQQVSLELAQEGGIGLADLLAQQLGGKTPVVEAEQAQNPLVSLETVAVGLRRQMLGMPMRQELLVEPSTRSVTDLADATAQQSKPTRSSFSGSPEEFVRKVWDDAVDAASELGLDPAVLIAQSALETGWGKKVIQTGDGASSFNLFGIKAGNGWQGPAATVKTLEFRGGLASLEKAAFRAYDSLSSAFKDYVSFLKENPRYQTALEKVSDSKAFLAELQEAGYATDPRYALKIQGILERGNYSNLIDELKNSSSQTLTDLSG